MLKFVLLAVAFNAALATENTVKLTAGKVYTELKSPGYPEVHSGGDPLTWVFETDPGSQIQIKCTDFRLTKSEDCQAIRLEIDYGDEKKSYCTPEDAFRTLSTGNKLTVKLVGDEYGQAAFACYVKSTEPAEVEEVAVKLNEVYQFGSPLSMEKDAVPYFDKLWKLKVEEGYQVDLNCYVNLLETEPCHDDVLTIDAGDGPQVYCGYQKELVFSKGSEATVRLELAEEGHGYVLCMAQAAIKKDAADIKEESTRAIGEDSSEHGGPAGQKGTTCRCGWANKSNKRVLYGEEASPNEFPWMVALQARVSGGIASCGGSIVTKRHVITAAHCVIDLYGDRSTIDAADLTVITGAHDLRRRSPAKHYAEYAVQKVYVRPEFPAQLTHDFAIVVLKKDIKFSDAVGPICLSPSSVYEANKRITIMGWGTSEKYFASPMLIKGKTTMINRNQCRIKPWEICTRTDPVATCSGDSGGPLVVIDQDTNRYFQASLVSYGHPDCVSTPSVSTDVAYFYKYLEGIIKDTYPNEKICTKA
uniref:Venom s1 protease with cub domain 1 n=1 Tax=Pristhesancus plagipennis TaxID=1955184 RepID=A0A1Q1NPJ0_PRIPG|nr:venom s1 protease with cub domain 1 [Pristhesancus plagipennis]